MTSEGHRSEHYAYNTALCLGGACAHLCPRPAAHCQLCPCTQGKPVLLHPKTCGHTPHTAHYEGSDMSTIIMSQCWPLGGMSPAQKAVLISLADQANDDGVCWPSVGTISQRTCLSERAVQNAIKWLADAGLLCARERSGTSSVYKITPAAYAPPQQMHPAANASTPAPAAPKPSLNRNLNRQRTANAQALGLDGVSDELLADWQAVRSAKRAGPLTVTAVKGLQREARKAGLTDSEAIEVCCTNGWQGFRAAWYRQDMQPAASRAAANTHKHAAAYATILEA